MTFILLFIASLSGRLLNGTILLWSVVDASRPRALVSNYDKRFATQVFVARSPRQGHRY